MVQAGFVIGDPGGVPQAPVAPWMFRRRPRRSQYVATSGAGEPFRRHSGRLAHWARNAKYPILGTDLVRGEAGLKPGQPPVMSWEKEMSARSYLRRYAGGLVAIRGRADFPVVVVVLVMVVAVPVVLALPRLAAPHVDPAHQRQPDHPHPGRAGQAGAGGPVVEAAHDAEPGHVHLDVLADGDVHPAHQGEDVDGHLALAEPCFPQVELDAAQDRDHAVPWRHHPSPAPVHTAQDGDGNPGPGLTAD